MGWREDGISREEKLKMTVRTDRKDTAVFSDKRSDREQRGSDLSDLFCCGGNKLLLPSESTSGSPFPQLDLPEPTPYFLNPSSCR